MNISRTVCVGSLYICLVLVSTVTSVKVQGSKETKPFYKYPAYKARVKQSESQNVLQPLTSEQTPEVQTEPSEAVTIAEASTELKRVITTETCQVKKSQRTFKWMVDECHTTSSLSQKKRRKLIADEETKRNILDLYSGIFFSQESALQLDSARQNSQTRPGGRAQRSTEGTYGDICCPSVSMLETAPTRMVNTYLQTRDVVHFHAEGLYQYINKGYCVTHSEQSCSGICVLQTRVIYLLVWRDPLPVNNSSLPMTFEPFDIPSFCSCKNITP